jgi:hypothetical protein
MNLVKKATTMDMNIKLSALWIFAVLNYLYCDVLGLTDPNMLTQLLSRTGPIQMTQGFLLGAAILMEIPIAMVLLSRVLKYKENRLANIIAGSIMSAVQISTLFVGTPTIYYVFFSVIEVACTLFIVGYAWRWNRASLPASELHADAIDSNA